MSIEHFEEKKTLSVVFDGTSFNAVVIKSKFS